jgi:hypothetical protein
MGAEVQVSTLSQDVLGVTNVSQKDKKTVIVIEPIK